MGKSLNMKKWFGYVIRSEEMVDTSSYTGNAKYIADDATRVGKGANIITYMSTQEESIKEKIEKLDSKIQKAMESRQESLSNDAKVIENEIEVNLYSGLRNNIDVYAVAEKKKMLAQKVEKKAKIIGDYSPVGSQIKALIEERTAYEKELNNSEKVLKAPTAGLVSYRIDHYEDVLTEASKSKLSSEYLNKLKLNTNQIIPISSNEVKIVNNFECYLATPMKSEESNRLAFGDTVYLRFDNMDNTLVNATVEYISEEEEGRLIFFKVASNVEQLTKYRKVSFDVVWWQDKGLKINNEAISQKDIIGTEGQYITLNTVSIKKGNSVKDVFVKVLRSAGGFSIIENYKDNELEEMGVPTEIISDRFTLKMYDEALIQ